MQKIIQNYLILSAKQYRVEVADEVTNQKTGEIIEGVTVRYLPDNDLTPRANQDIEVAGLLSRGLEPAKLSLPLEKANQISELPGLYNVELEFVIVRDKQQVRIKNLEFVSAARLTQVKHEQPK